MKILLAKLGKMINLLIVSFAYVFISCGLFILSAYSEDIYFIQGQPQWDMEDLSPYPTIIYRLDEDGKVLIPVWSSENNVKTNNIDIYASSGSVLISEGSWYPTKLRCFTSRDINDIETIEFRDDDRVRKYHYYQYPEGRGQVEIMKQVSATKGNPFTFERVDIENKVSGIRKIAVDSGGELRLSGCLPPYASGDNDIIPLKLSADRRFEPLNPLIALNDAPVPEGLIRMTNSRGWSLIANEHNFRAILSAPNDPGLTQRELLLYDRITNQWSSILIEGGQSCPRLINKWLVSVIADIDPETDYSQAKGFPPILREDAVFVDPLNGHQFKEHLGKGGEVLWIENESVYFGVGNELYKARIENDRFVGQSLLLTDTCVNFIHWGFGD